MRRDGRAVRRAGGAHGTARSRTPEPGSVLAGEAQPGRDEGVAELGDRLGSNTVQPGEIGLGHLGELLKGDIPRRGECLPSWPGQAGGQARGLVGSVPGHAATRSARWARELPTWSGGNGWNPM